MASHGREVLLAKIDLEKEFPKMKFEYNNSGDWFVARSAGNLTDEEQDTIGDRMQDIVEKHFSMVNRDDHSPSVTVITPAIEAKKQARAQAVQNNRDCGYCGGSHPPEENCWDRHAREYGWAQEKWERVQIMNKDYEERREEIMSAYDLQLQEQKSLRNAASMRGCKDRESYLDACGAYWDYLHSRPSLDKQNDERFVGAVARGVSPFKIDPPGWVHPRDR